ncbi:MAG: selenoneine synthase SenA [Betaproteobacteria bacterium]|nr:selenoneine synthase SenA [Betaproteobacteria bacterium]
MEDTAAERNGKRHTVPAPALARWVEASHRRTLALVADLSDAQWSVPRLEHLNPFRWELGHTAFFYDVFVLRLLGAQALLLPGADALYDSFAVAHDDRWGLSLPSREETLDYKARVLRDVKRRLEGRSPDGEETYLYLLALAHEGMHIEAFASMRQALAYPAPPTACPPPDGGPLPGDVSVPGGTCLLGAQPDAPFVFDNEKWAHAVELPPFRIAKAPVTNAEFAAFVDDGGYLRPELWSRQGWGWRQTANANHPLYWERADTEWMHRHFDRRMPLKPHAPVIHVNWYEAEAWCHWARRRLPTEAEWELAAGGEPAPDGNGLGARKRRYPWGNEPPTPEQANLDFRCDGCADVAAFPAGDSAFGCRQMLGNLWQWTDSPFYPFPGYVVDSPYKEYSAPWFGARKVLRGGAWASSAQGVRNTYRNFFPPHRRDIFAGFRTCARD